MSKGILKYRHLYGELWKDKIENVKPATGSTESCPIMINSQYIAFPWDATGGALAVIKNSAPCKLNPAMPMILAHSMTILDQQFYPYDERYLATSSMDGNIKIWKIPEPFDQSLVDPVSVITGPKRVNLIQWSHTAQWLMASAANDESIRIWNAEKPDINMQFKVNGITENASSIDWNYNCSLIGSTWKDKKIRIADPKSLSYAVEKPGHEGPKSSKFIWLGDTNYALTTGFSKTYERQFSLWDSRNWEKPVNTTNLDNASGVLYPHYNAENGLLYIWGKGDGNIRYYEFHEGVLHFTLDYKTSDNGIGYGFLPRRLVAVEKNELDRVYKLGESKIEIVSLIAPRKSEGFQADLYPDYISNESSLDAEAWFKGSYSPPIKKSYSCNPTITKREFKDLAPSKFEQKGEEKKDSKNGSDKIINDLKTEVETLKKVIEEKNIEISTLKFELEEAKKKAKSS